jgi:hypothetical protein
MVSENFSRNICFVVGALQLLFQTFALLYGPCNFCSKCSLSEQYVARYAPKMIVLNVDSLQNISVENDIRGGSAISLEIPNPWGSECN